MEIENKILKYGNFVSALDYVEKFVDDESTTSLIIVGNSGSGKTTLIEEVARRHKEAKFIQMNPYQFQDDHRALLRIAHGFGFTPTSIRSDIIYELRAHASKNKKAVIVLKDLEVWCRNKQSLLYNLTSLMQAQSVTSNAKSRAYIKLICLTASSDCLNTLEKRNRSRLSANSLRLYPPYSTLDEFKEFTWKLLGGYKIKNELFNEKLEILYDFSKYSIRPLKKFLILGLYRNGTHWKIDEDELLLPVEREQRNFIIRLKSLTRPQLDMLKWAASYCHQNSTCRFKLKDLTRFAGLRSKVLDFTESWTRKDLELLNRMGLIMAEKMDKVLNHSMQSFTLNIIPIQFRHAIEETPELSNIRTDLLWKNLFY